MVLTLSTFGQPPSSPGPNKVGNIPMKKRQHLRIEEDFSANKDNELQKKKKVEENTIDTQEEISSFLAIVKASNLHNDAMDLPQDFTRSNGFTKDLREIVITNDEKKSWVLDLKFNNSSETFYMKKGWRNFCEENGQRAGDFFVFDLLKNKERLSLNFSPKKLKIAGKEGDKDTNVEKWRNSASSSKNKFVTLNVTNDSLKHSRLYLPLSFMRENGLDKPGIITLVGKDGTKRAANIKLERTRRMSLGKGWNDFAKANGFRIGDSISFELTWEEEATPMLSLFSIDSSNDRRQPEESSFKARETEPISTEPCSGKKIKKATKYNEKSSSQELEGNTCLHNGEHASRLVKLTLEPEDVKAGKLHIPSEFMEANGINKLGKIEILGQNKRQWFGYLLSKLNGTVALGSGWEGFCEAHDVKPGDSFILKFICEQEGTPVVKFRSSIRGCIGCDISMDLVEFLI